MRCGGCCMCQRGPAPLSIHATGAALRPLHGLLHVVAAQMLLLVSQPQGDSAARWPCRLIGWPWPAPQRMDAYACWRGTQNITRSASSSPRKLSLHLRSMLHPAFPRARVPAAQVAPPGSLPGMHEPLVAAELCSAQRTARSHEVGPLNGKTRRHTRR